MATPRTYVDIFAAGSDFSVRASTGGSSRVLNLGADAGAKVFLNDADLIRLRDVIDAHLTSAAELRAAAGIVDRSAA